MPLLLSTVANALLANGSKPLSAGYATQSGSLVDGTDLFERYRYMHSPPPFVLAISDFTRTHLMRHHGLPATQIHVLRSAIDPERLTATDRPAQHMLSRQRWGIEPDDVLVSSLASIRV
jgi:hypothetical protein